MGNSGRGSQSNDHQTGLGSLPGHSRAILWPRPGVTELAEAVPVGACQPGEVGVAVDASVTNTGTERARYLSLPNATIGFPHTPGYGAVGRTLTALPGIPAGSRVAVRSSPHQRIVIVPAHHIRRIPRSMRPADAALWQLAVTARYGLDAGLFRPPEPVTIIGAGLLGTLTRRIARACGARCCHVVARSRAKEWALLHERDTSFVLEHEMDGPLAGRHDLVIDATGTPDGLVTAVATVKSGGRVVILGSPRVKSSPVPLGDIHAKGLRIIGAHIDTLPRRSEIRSADLGARYTEEYFSMVTSGKLSMNDAVESHAPEEAPSVYRRLATERSFIAAIFRWCP